MVRKALPNREHNAIHDAAIWRNAIEKELLASKVWQDQWGFYKEDGPSDASVHLPAIAPRYLREQSSHPSKLPKGLSTDPDSTISAYLSSYHTKELLLHQYPQEKYTIPPTTSMECGWTWVSESQRVPFGQALKRPDQKLGTYSLERFPTNYQRRSVYKWWGGGPDSLKRMR